MYTRVTGETQHLLALSSELRKRYHEESRFAYESGAALESNVLLEMQPKHSYNSTSTIAGGLKLGKYHVGVVVAIFGILHCLEIALIVLAVPLVLF